MRSNQSEVISSKFLYICFVRGVNLKAISTVMNTTQEVVKIRPEEKIQACTGFEPITFAIPLHCTMCRKFKLFTGKCLFIGESLSSQCNNQTRN